MREQTRPRVTRGRIAALFGIALGLLATGPGSAQSLNLTGWRFETGLLSFFTGQGRSVLVTVTEVAGTRASSQVRIDFRDAAGRLVARERGVLEANVPVRLDLPLDMSEIRVQLRASVTIVGQPGRQTTPIVVVEDIDPGAFTIVPRVSCAPPAPREGPVTPFCPEVAVTNIAVGG